MARGLTDFGLVREVGEGVDRIYKDMSDFFLDEPFYEATNNYVDLILKNNIWMRTYRRENAVKSMVRIDWSTLNYVEQKALQIVYEKRK